MSIQDPSIDPRQQSYGANAPAEGYTPVAEAASQRPADGPNAGDPYRADYVPPVYGSQPLPGAPNPGLAALLGFIPGVGAMYNGQFPKGIAHIAIFAVFSSLSKHVNGVFGLFVAGWVFYMVFEAYQTARARRDGLPLPDPFGLNNIGERFGFRGNPDFSSFWSHPPQASAPPQGRPVDPVGAPHYPQPDAGYQVDPAGNVYRAQAPGYVPPVPPVGYPPYGPPPSATYAAPGYADAPAGGGPPVPPVPPMPPSPPVLWNGLPSGALWLIGLGLFALLGSLRSFSFLEGEATGGLFLMGLSLFLLWRRYSFSHAMYPADAIAARWNTVRTSRGAAVLFVVGLLTLLQGLHVVDWENSWPVLLIALGTFILVERLALNRMSGAAAYPAAEYTGAPVQPAPADPVVETSSPTSIVPKYTRPDNDLNSREGR